MANFTSINFQVDVGGGGTPNWVNIAGSSQEIRAAATNTVPLNTPSASWPGTNKGVSGSVIQYFYAFTADTVGLLLPYAHPSAPQTYNARWTWDNVGTFSSAPIFTAYASSSHAAITRGDGSLLGGHASDTGATARSYLKGNAWGRVSSAGVPALGPATGPAATDGTTGSAGPTAGANWMSNWQGLQGDADFITAPFTPAATTSDSWPVAFALFVGAHENVGALTFVFTLKYTYS